MSKWKYGRMGNYKAKGQSAQDEWNANVPDSWNGYAPSNYDSFSPPQQSNDIPYDSFSPPPPKTDKGVPLNRQDSYSPPLLGGDESLVPKRELPELEPDARGGGGLQIMEDQDEAWKKWQEELERQKKVWWRGRS